MSTTWTRGRSGPIASTATDWPIRGWSRRSTTFELDGLRTDVTGRIFVARPSAGDVSIVNPDGSLVRKVATLGKEPTNLTFGGVDGKTVFVTQKDGKFIEAFLTDQPGREFAPHEPESFRAARQARQ